MNQRINAEHPGLSRRDQGLISTSNPGRSALGPEILDAVRQCLYSSAMADDDSRMMENVTPPSAVANSVE